MLVLQLIHQGRWAQLLVELYETVRVAIQTGQIYVHPLDRLDLQRSHNRVRADHGQGLSLIHI